MVGFKKHGVGEVLPDSGNQDLEKTATTQGFDQDDEDALLRENTEADKE